MKKRSDYLQRQIYILSNIGLFYLIIIALFAIPMIGAFVAVFIKGVIDLKYAIIIGSILILIGIIYCLVRLLIGLYRKFRKDGIAANQDFKELLQRGEPVQVSLLDGLVTLSSGRDYQQMKPITDSSQNGNPLISNGGKQVFLLSQDTADSDSVHTIIEKLKELSELRDNSVISEEEFQILKKKLMNES